ncbi:hypothetical protein FQN60_006566 [Etheostoma spectabile]|uniref:Uncharacterized protein n=1 Tax=Etheostoma spectabile TaxID=54343 RepID=A0A5J5CEP8_9PERO|nr:hypothetical protein FQN60_006566 [Etheostoma spectabile]
MVCDSFEVRGPGWGTQVLSRQIGLISHRQRRGPRWGLLGARHIHRREKLIHELEEERRLRLESEKRLREVTEESEVGRAQMVSLQQQFSSLHGSQLTWLCAVVADGTSAPPDLGQPPGASAPLAWPVVIKLPTDYGETPAHNPAASSAHPGRPTTPYGQEI